MSRERWQKSSFSISPIKENDRPEPRLFDRIGDYVLIMKENYIIKDFVLGETEKFHIGNHGGVSKEEMLVPLIVIES
jgi:hypothetical protein